MDKAQKRMTASRGLIAALLCLCGTVSGSVAGAESFRDRIEYGNALLNSGDFEGAREVYRNLQIEHPEDEIVYYSLGCADYEEGQSVSALQDPQGSIEFFESARDAFGQAMTSRDEWLRVDASLNHAKSVAQIAKQRVALGDQKAVIAAFEESVGAYEQVLERYPDHKGARHNLDHMRYLLKRMLQNPPKSNEQSQEQQEQEGQQDQQQQQQGQQQQDQNKPGEQDQEEQKEQQEAQDEQEQQKQDGEQQQQQQAKAQQQAAASASEEDVSDSKDQEDTKDRQTMEAILQSLEAQDKREQQDLRTGVPDSHVRKEWW